MNSYRIALTKPMSTPKRAPIALRMTVMSPSPSATVDAVAIATPKSTWHTVTGLDAAEFYPRRGVLPAVTAVRDQSGPWTTVGQTRTLVLSDGGHVVETITDASSPTFFAYDLSDFQKLFGWLVSGATATWSFEREETGTRIRWTYAFHPRPGRRWVVALIVRLAWAPYMRLVLPPIAAEASRVRS